MPEGSAVGHGVERENLFDSAVAIRRDDEDLTRKTATFARDSHDNIVVEFALFPMIEQFISPKANAYLFEQRAQNEGVSQFLNDRVHARWLSSTEPREHARFFGANP
jgi:hypothetical protein